jgi:hypothetical protein
MIDAYPIDTCSGLKEPFSFLLRRSFTEHLSTSRRRQSPGFPLRPNSLFSAQDLVIYILLFPIRWSARPELCSLPHGTPQGNFDRQGLLPHKDSASLDSGALGAPQLLTRQHGFGESSSEQ